MSKFQFRFAIQEVINIPIVNIEIFNTALLYIKKIVYRGGVRDIDIIAGDWNSIHLYFEVLCVLA